CENAAIIGNGFQTIKMYDENTSLHSVNVAVMATMFGMSLGYDPRKLNNLGVGGLLHDIGKSRVPIEIIGKSGKLDEEEILEVRKHPQHGWDILDKDVLIPATVKAIALQHHENWDGSGYPRGIREYEVYELAAIVHICDVFDALISKRTYKDSFSFTDSINYMKSQSGKMFSPYFLKYFFRNVPIFHTGTDVRLSNGEKAIIVSNNSGDMTRPVVRLYKDMSEINLCYEKGIEIVS
ncbi:MAG: HD-GYP domain-containing protein, partial [Lachnospiraceae bacterium]|nr:HD-GYP domain-containing protein [Lachnospiraceae bacterium]